MDAFVHLTSGVQHAVTEISRHGSLTLAVQFAGEVAGSGRDIEHHARRGQAQVGDRAATPTSIETKRHQLIHELVASRDGVEHGTNLTCFLLTLGERGRRHGR